MECRLLTQERGLAACVWPAKKKNNKKIWKALIELKQPSFATLYSVSQKMDRYDINRQLF